MVKEGSQIRVNSWREKRALSTLSLALGVLGLTLDDLKNAAELVRTNKSLEQENAELSKRLDAATGGKKLDPSEQNAILSSLKGPDTMKLTKAGENN